MSDVPEKQCAGCTARNAALAEYLAEVKALTTENYGTKMELAKAAARERKLEAEVARLTLALDEMGGQGDE